MEDSKETNKFRKNKHRKARIITLLSSKELFDQIENHFAENESAFYNDNPKINYLKKNYFTEKVNHKFEEFERITVAELTELFRYYPEFIPKGKVEDIDIRIIDDNNNEIFRADILKEMLYLDPTLHIYQSILFSELNRIGKEKTFQDGINEIEDVLWFSMKATFLYFSKPTNQHRLGESFYKSGIGDCAYFDYKLQKLLSSFSIDIITGFQQ